METYLPDEISSLSIIVLGNGKCPSLRQWRQYQHCQGNQSNRAYCVLEDFVASPNITASIDYGQERKALIGDYIQRMKVSLWE